MQLTSQSQHQRQRTYLKSKLPAHTRGWVIATCKLLASSVRLIILHRSSLLPVLVGENSTDPWQCSHTSCSKVKSHWQHFVKEGEMWVPWIRQEWSVTHRVNLARRPPGALRSSLKVVIELFHENFPTHFLKSIWSYQVEFCGNIRWMIRVRVTWF